MVSFLMFYGAVSEFVVRVPWCFWFLFLEGAVGYLLFWNGFDVGEKRKEEKRREEKRRGEERRGEERRDDLFHSFSKVSSP